MFLTEDGDYLLFEDGAHILFEDANLAAAIALHQLRQQGQA